MRLHYLLTLACLLHCAVGRPWERRQGKITKAHNLELSPSDYLFGKFPSQDTELVAGIRRTDPSPVPLRAEPDAEMLPLHYSGVKSPGVDHMELKKKPKKNKKAAQRKITVKDEVDEDFAKIFEELDNDKGPSEINSHFFSEEDDTGFEGLSNLKSSSQESASSASEYDDFFKQF